MENFKKNYHELNVKYALSAKDLVDNVKIVFIVTAWKDFLKLDFSGKKVYDLRYMLNHTE
jgi:UDP-glucose 6-dehydrogenase